MLVRVKNIRFKGFLFEIADSRVNALSVWNTAYLQKAIEHLKASGDSADEDLLKHIAPLGWEHVNLLGEYTFDVRDMREPGELRPLNL